MRHMVLCLVIATPAAGWEFTPGLPCLLTHEAEGVQVQLTHDPTGPLYSITIRRDSPWPAGDVFSMRFEGTGGLSISTDRHMLGTDRRAVTVTDRGFGNVLNGLQFNDSATAMLGGASVTVSLRDAAGPVADFRLCRAAPGV